MAHGIWRWVGGLTAALALGCSDSSRSAAVATGPTGPVPTVTGVAPNTGPVAGGTLITITGTNFVSGSIVRVAGVAATSITFVSATQLTAVTPAGSAGPANVTVRNPSGTSGTATNGFTYTSGPAPAPTITAVSPSTGSATGGTTITITGSGFQTGATVTVGGVAATGVTVLTAGTLTAVTPAGVNGAAAVTVTNPDLQFATLASGFTYTGGPTLTGVTPSAGDVSGGTPVSLTGSGFQTGATVTFGSNAATSVVIVNGSTITCVTPAGSAGAVTVTVWNPNATSAPLASGFTYTTGGTLPTVTNVTPAFGFAAGGQVITITGTNFQSGVTVTVGGVAATSVTLTGSTQITCIVPAATPGAPSGATVTVTNPGGASASWSGTFQYVPSPVATTTAISTVPDVAVDGSGRVHVVWMEYVPAATSYQVLYRRSTDGGATWSGSTTVSGTSTQAWDPAIAVRGSDVVVVWREVIFGTPNAVHVYYAESTDAGVSFTSPVSVANTGAGAWPTPDVAFTSNGTVAVVWDQPNPNVSVMDVRSRTGTVGGSFGTIRIISQATVLSSPAIATAGTGTLHVVFRAYVPFCPAAGPGGIGWEIFHSRSTNTGTSWSSAVNVSNNCGMAPMQPAIAANGAVVVVAWSETNGTTSQDVRAITSTDAGVTWANTSVLVSKTSGATRTEPGLVFDSAGVCTAVWTDDTPGSGNTDIYLSRSTTNGATWGTAVNIANTTGASVNPAVASGNGRTVTVWSDATTGNGDILAY